MRTSTSSQSHNSIATSSSQSHSSTSVLSSTPRVVSPTWMRTSTSSSQSHNSTSILSSNPSVVSPTRMRTSTSSSQYHISTSALSSTPRVVSPTRMRTSTSSTRTHSQSHSSTSILSSTLRGGSPTRMRTSISSSQSHSSTSGLSFIVDFTKGRKSASQIEDAHQLCLLYNRYLQWRFDNAHAEIVLQIQKVNAEEILYNVGNATLSLGDTLIKKKINLQRLKLELNLNSVLNHQMEYLYDWELLERDHMSTLAGAEEDLEASTLHLPVTGGARADIESLKAAICSAVDVMHAMGSSICSTPKGGRGKLLGF